MKGLTRLFTGRLLLCACLCVATSAKADIAVLDTVRQLHMQVFRISCDLFVQRGELGLAVDQQAVQAELLQATRLLEQIVSVENSVISDEQRDALLALWPAFEHKVADAAALDLHEQDFEWDFNLTFTEQLRELDTLLESIATSLSSTTEQQLLYQQAVRIQYMAARYTARAYIGALHTLDQDGYFDRDLNLLADDMDQVLMQLSQSGVSSEQLKPVSHRWRYIRGRYQDYQVNLAPMVVAKQTRTIVDNLLVLARSLSG
ncbi:hypothetical protein [Kistimonas asteriae]|uniref:hypothetical protein n=1 Tax=Kistimonas asteriae TaxID=517724 RepID=UPI001BA9AD22|nr:hypothetical protein [Kistimonas asteriae]